MFGCKSFLLIGPDTGADIVSLIKGGYELLDCNFSFQQGIDDKGKATTRVHSGSINLTVSQLPDDPLVDWALDSRKYCDGVIVLVDAENIPIEKVYFENTACTGFDIRYSLSDKTYAATKISLKAEKITVADDVDFKNNWSFD